MFDNLCDDGRICNLRKSFDYFVLGKNKQNDDQQICQKPDKNLDDEEEYLDEDQGLEEEHYEKDLEDEQEKFDQFLDDLWNDRI